MSEFEDKLNKLLNDPHEMERFADFAKSIMGGSPVAQPSEKAEAFDAPDPAMLQQLSGLLKNGGGKDSKDKKLLEAMRPYLSEKRRSKMDKAMKIARLAGIAELAAGSLGGDDNGDV